MTTYSLVIWRPLFSWIHEHLKRLTSIKAALCTTEIQIVLQGQFFYKYIIQWSCKLLDSMNMKYYWKHSEWEKIMYLAGQISGGGLSLCINWCESKPGLRITNNGKHVYSGLPTMMVTVTNVKVANTDNKDAQQILVIRYGTSIYKHYSTNIKQNRRYCISQMGHQPCCNRSF